MQWMLCTCINMALVPLFSSICQAFRAVVRLSAATDHSTTAVMGKLMLGGTSTEQPGQPGRTGQVEANHLSRLSCPSWWSRYPSSYLNAGGPWVALAAPPSHCVLRRDKPRLSVIASRRDKPRHVREKSHFSKIKSTVFLRP